ncbi:MAG TPA: NYN domain-containing protein [Thermoanaerobaculia bacterium]|jgi:predicted RNA-binding protein with PIN domain|nr:NYN domain-containing protein [Thermoanaerobaculia bacterium]
MSWVIDGNNLLGRAGASREAADSKRQLIRALANFARAKRTKVACYFDGSEPEHFGRHLGSVSVIFSGARSADELIVKRVAAGKGWKVVTADRALAARIRRREVEIIDPGGFIAELESLPPAEENVAGDEWTAWFSDPKNRNVF